MDTIKDKIIKAQLDLILINPNDPIVSKQIKKVIKNLIEIEVDITELNERKKKNEWFKRNNTRGIKEGYV